MQRREDQGDALCICGSSVYTSPPFSTSHIRSSSLRHVAKSTFDRRDEQDGRVKGGKRKAGRTGRVYKMGEEGVREKGEIYYEIRTTRRLVKGGSGHDVS